VKKVINFIKDEQKSEESPSLVSQSLKTYLEERDSKIKTFFSGKDSLYEEAKQVVIEGGRASASFLQRRLRIGYARAARLLDMLEEKGIVGPGQGAKPREVYGERENDVSQDINEESEW